MSEINKEELEQYLRKEGLPNDKMIETIDEKLKFLKEMKDPENEDKSNVPEKDYEVII